MRSYSAASLCPNRALSLWISSSAASEITVPGGKIASAFADIGFDVDIGPLFATADEAARQAVENDVHILGVSSLAAAHLTAVPELKAALKKHGREDIMIIIGGVVPPQDYDALYAAGAEAIFPPGTVIAEAAESLLHKLNQRLGHGQQAAE